MYVVAVTVFVKPEFVEQFLEATLDNARHTRREPGNVRFDVLRAEDDPGRFLLYEAYHDKDGFVKHQQTEHSLVTNGDTPKIVIERTIRFADYRVGKSFFSRTPTQLAKCRRKPKAAKEIEAAGRR